MAVEPLERALERAALQTATHHAADLVARDEAGILQDAQMLDKTRERHPERLGQRADRMLAVAELRQHGAPRRIGERAEYGIETGGVIVNHLVHFTRKIFRRQASKPEPGVVCNPVPRWITRSSMYQVAMPVGSLPLALSFK